MKNGRLLLFTSALMVLTPFVGNTEVSFAEPVRPAPDDWLGNVNWYRSQSGLTPVVENTAWSAGAYNHSCYMTLNTITHTETPGAPGYTSSGYQAGINGNVAVSSTTEASAQYMIDLWMTGPFHAIGLLRPQWNSTGFGICKNPNTNPWKTGATLDVLRGLPSATTSTPVLFPGNGSVTPLNQFITETPNPLTMCNYPSAGLPLIALLPEDPGNSVSGSVTLHDGTSSQVCILHENNTTGVAQDILEASHAVIIVPRLLLPEGNVSATLTTQSRSLAWSFVVDATPYPPLPLTPPPTPQASNISSGQKYGSVAPTRIVDSRIGLGLPSAPLNEDSTVFLDSSLFSTLPSAQTAQLTLTAVSPTQKGFLSVFPCTSATTSPPGTSVLNFEALRTTANTVTVPLGISGGICVYTSKTTHLLVDTQGYFSTAAPGKADLTAIQRIVDTRENNGPKIAEGANITVTVPSAAGKTAAFVNVTSASSSASGFFTIWDCSSPRPTTSTLNYQQGVATVAATLAPLNAAGQFCVYTSKESHIIVDLSGTVSDSGARSLTTSSPFRVLDTRIAGFYPINPLTGGAKTAANVSYFIPLAGLYGIPSTAKGISGNITMVSPDTSGYVLAFSCGTPQGSSVNAAPNTAVANNINVGLSSSGNLCFRSNTRTHILLDVVGWWE